MTKKDLVKKAQENLKEKDIKLSLKDVDEAVDAIFLAMMQGLKEEGEVFIKGIISLKVKDVPEKEVPVTVYGKDTGESYPTIEFSRRSLYGGIGCVVKLF